MNILKIFTAVVGFMIAAGIVVIAIIKVVKHMTLSEIGDKLLGYLGGFLVGICLLSAGFMLLDWAFAIGHPWIGAVIVMIVVFSFLIIARLEKDK